MSTLTTEALSYQQSKEERLLDPPSQGEEFWNYRKIAGWRIAGLKEIHDQLMVAQSEEEDFFVLLGDAINESERRHLEKRELLDDLYISGGRVSSGSDFKERTPHQKAQALQAALETHPDITQPILDRLEELNEAGKQEDSQFDFLLAFYEKKAQTSVLARKIESTQDQVFMMPDSRHDLHIFNPDYIDMASSELMEKELPPNHFFHSIMAVYVDDYSPMSETQVDVLLYAGGVELGQLPTDKIGRKLHILEKASPLLLESASMPKRVRARFRQVLATYIYDAGTKACPWYDWKDWVDVDSIEFLEILNQRARLEITGKQKMDASGDPGWKKKRDEDTGRLN